MARASRLKTIFGGPQGEGKKVILIIPTIGEMRHQRKETLALIEKLGNEAEEVEANANGYMADHIVDWNWEDDDGKVFPLPRTDPAVLHLLTQEELNFIALAMAGQSSDEVANRKK